MNKNKSTERPPYVKAVDSLRVVSILGVLLIHTTTKVLEFSHYDLLNYQMTLFLNQFARFAVPLFFIISGFVLELNYNYHLGYMAYLKKRFVKVFIPYVFWSLIYYYFIYNQNHDNLIHVILTGNASYQLYFIPTLCIFYLLFPFLHKIYKYLASIPVLAILGTIEIWLMNQDYLVSQFKLADPIRISILGSFFFIIGMVVANNKVKILEITSRLKYFLIISAVFLMNFVFQEGKNRYFQTYNIEAFYSQWRPSILFYTLTLGLLLFYVFDKSKLQFKFLETLSKLSYLVFFIHIIILEQIWKYFGLKLFNQIASDSFEKSLFDIAFFLAVAALSFLVSYILHKIPKLSKAIG